MDINEKLKPYIDAAVEVQPPPSGKAWIMNTGRDMMKDGSAFNNPTGLDKVIGNADALANAMDSIGELDIINGDSASTITSIVYSSIFGDIRSAAKVAQANLQKATDITDNMFKQVNPFAEKVDLGDGVAPVFNRSRLSPNLDLSSTLTSPEAKMFGAPTFQSTIGLPSSNQSTNSSAGLTGDNPCGSIFSTVGELATTVADKVSEIASMIGSGIDGAIGFVNDVISGTNEAINRVVNNVMGVVGDIMDWTQSGINQVIDKVSNAISGMQDTISGVIGDVMDMVGGIADKAMEVYGSVVSVVNDMVSGIVESAMMGISNMISGLTSSNPCMQAMIAGLGDDNNIVSPSMKDAVMSTVNQSKII